MQKMDLAVDELLARQPWLFDLYRRRPNSDAYLCPSERFESRAASEYAAPTDERGTGDR